MRYKEFKNAGCKVSELAVGTWATGGQNYGKVNFKDSISAIVEMVDRGVNLIDTAPVYGNGTSEKVVGEVLKSIQRDKVLISTKAGLITDIYTRDAVKDASYRNIMREIDSSLKNLNTDYIDFYFVHWPDATTPISETMAALNYLKDQGYIRYIGVSNFSREQIIEAQQYAQIDVQQPPFSMVNMKEIELIKWGHEQGITSMSYGSLGAGILSGTIRENPNLAKDDIRMTFYDYYHEPKFSKIQQLLTLLDEIGEKYGKSIPQIVINWSTQQEYIGTALVGVNTVEQAIENCSTFDWKLNEDDLNRISQKIQELEI